MTEDQIREFGAGIQRLIQGNHMNRQVTYGMFREVLSDQQPDLQQGAMLAALVAKGETAEEIAGAWQAIDELDTAHTETGLEGPLFENSGTGMDGLKTFNVSTASAIVAAAAGVTMARHGARALTSKCGTVDMAEALGVDVDCEVSVVENSIREAGIGLFNGMSPQIHPGALGRILSQIRFGSTLNIAASLANPARPTLGLRGVYSERLVPLAGEVMRQIGYSRGMVTYGTDEASGLGMDEISPCGETVIQEFSDSGIRDYCIFPEDVGVARLSFEEIAFKGGMQEEVKRFLAALSGADHKGCQEFIALNAGAILYVAGKADTHARGIEMAREIITTGRAIEKLRQWVRTQNSEASKGTEILEGLLSRIECQNITA